jgi:hypothetical protein
MKRPHLTATEIESLDLFDALCTEAMADNFAAVDAVLKTVWAPTKDKTRKVPRSLRVVAYNRDGGQCRYCRVTLPLSAAQADHVIPHSRGGQTVAPNLWTACGPCNRAKSNKVW